MIGFLKHSLLLKYPWQPSADLFVSKNTILATAVSLMICFPPAHFRLISIALHRWGWGVKTGKKSARCLAHVGVTVVIVDAYGEDTAWVRVCLYVGSSGVQGFTCLSNLKSFFFPSKKWENSVSKAYFRDGFLWSHETSSLNKAAAFKFGMLWKAI